MSAPKQLEFANFASEGLGGSGTGKCRPDAREAIRGPSRGLRGAVPAGSPGRTGTPTLPAATPPRPKLVAAVYAEEADDRGNLRLRKVTTTRWLTVRQIADTLRVSVQAIYSRIEFGDLPAHRIGNTIRISSDDFEAYLRRTSTEEEW